MTVAWPLVKKILFLGRFLRKAQEGHLATRVCHHSLPWSHSCAGKGVSFQWLKCTQGANEVLDLAGAIAFGPHASRATMYRCHCCGTRPYPLSRKLLLKPLHKCDGLKIEHTELTFRRAAFTLTKRTILETLGVIVICVGLPTWTWGVTSATGKPLFLAWSLSVVEKWVLSFEHLWSTTPPQLLQRFIHTKR